MQNISLDNNSENIPPDTNSEKMNLYAPAEEIIEKEIGEITTSDDIVENVSAPNKTKNAQLNHINSEHILNSDDIKEIQNQSSITKSTPTISGTSISNFYINR